MSLIDRFMTGEYTVLRTKKGTYVKGRYVAGPQEEIEVCGSMQPTTAREMGLKEEGARIKEIYKFFTDEKIVTGSPKTLADADYITVNGDSYRAMAPLNWQGTDLDHFMTVIWRDPEQDSDGEGTS